MGLRLNVLAGTVVVLGAVVAVGLGWLLGIDSAAVLGLFSRHHEYAFARRGPANPVRAPRYIRGACGASGLGVRRFLSGGDHRHHRDHTPILQKMLRLDPRRAAEAFASEQRKAVEPLEQRTLLINNPNLEGITIDSVPGLTEHGVVVSRIRRRGETEVQIATGSSLLHQGDLILVSPESRPMPAHRRTFEQ